MITASLLALSFLGLVIAPCAIGLRIRASLHHPITTTPPPGKS